MSPSQLMLVALVFVHLIGDYPLQGDFLAKAKHHKAPVAGVPWLVALASHAGIHAGLVAVTTGSPALSVLEFGFHGVIDFAKNEGWLGAGEQAYTLDQVLHVVCKIMWTLLLMKFPTELR